jgi:hypothetical protein
VIAGVPTPNAIRAAPTQSIRTRGRASGFAGGHRLPGEREGGDSDYQSQDEDGAVSETIDHETAELRVEPAQGQPAKSRSASVTRVTHAPAMALQHFCLQPEHGHTAHARVRHSHGRVNYPDRCARCHTST